jgi:hypothetical protein
MAHAQVYFVQGILGLARLAVSFFFKDTLKVEPAEVGGGWVCTAHIQRCVLLLR